MKQLTQAVQYRVKLFLLSLLFTLIIVRGILFYYPSLNFVLAQYEIHHLYTGAFILIILIPFLLAGIRNSFVTFFSGIAVGLVVDELVYLIIGPGTDAFYMTRASIFGAIIMVFVTILTALLALKVKKE